MKINIKRHLLGLLAVPALVLCVAAAATPAFADCSNANTNNLSLCGGASSSQSSEAPTSLFGAGGIFQTITNVLLFVIGAVSVVMLIIGGIRYTISQGDSSAVTSAKNTILYAVVGLVVAILAFAAVNFVITSFANKQ